MINIQPQYLNLIKLLSGRLLRIPEYQRAYSWGSTQRKDLFDDLIKARRKGTADGHFMAAVVCHRLDVKQLGTDEYQVLNIVDGQQRITTLVILLKSLSLALSVGSDAEQTAHRELRDLLVKPDGSDLLLLQTNHDSNHYYSKFMVEGGSVEPALANSLADREILSAIRECKSFITKFQEEGFSLLELTALLKNRLFFLLHETADEKSVYTVFEVLNSRGLEVSWLDRLKSILMATAFELENADTKQLIHDLHVFWKDIYREIGLRQGLSPELLRFAATLRSTAAPSKTMSEADAVTLFRTTSISGVTLRDSARWILKVAEACEKVVSSRRQSAVSRIAQARLLAVAIHLREDFTERERTAALGAWEKVTFRIYGMLRRDARTRVGEYVRLAHRVINEKFTIEETLAGIDQIGQEFPIDVASEALRSSDCYHDWDENLRYFMFRREEYLAKEKGQNFDNEIWEKIWQASASDSIEHIYPQSSCPEEHKNRLGNLTLLPPKLNSKLSNRAPEEKAPAYRDTGLGLATEIVAIVDESGWGPEQIDAREKTLIDWAKEEWGD